MNIEDTNKISNLDILDTKCNFKILELEGINLDDDWSKLSKLKNLETLILKDSYIDFKKFYNAIFSLKKLNKLKLNHYCYFNKSKNEKFEKDSKLSSLKEFCLEFPNPDEPDFEINNWSQKSYENKFNSITDVPNSHNIFPNLEIIKLINYETYKQRILKEDEYNKKIFKEIYWNTKLDDLKKFKKLKNIIINNGNISDLYTNGLDHFVKTLEKQKINFTINNVNETSKLNLDFKTVNFFCGFKDTKTNLCLQLDTEFLNILRENNIIIDKDVFNISEFDYYKDTYKMHPNETVVPLEMSQYLKKPVMLKPIVNTWLPDKFITVQWDSTDAGRTISPIVRERIHSKYKGAVIYVGGEGVGNFKTSLAHIGAAMAKADYHVGSDSGMMHLAQLYKKFEDIHVYSPANGYISHHLVRAINNGTKHSRI